MLANGEKGLRNQRAECWIGIEGLDARRQLELAGWPVLPELQVAIQSWSGCLAEGLIDKAQPCQAVLHCRDVIFLLADVVDNDGEDLW
jgi:hypothetical protein